ncbi:MAG: biopolymer transporter ExbD [Verrucomicrobia bacterium]|nr:MAG: biopolymer transporter ExbD [Verrucomicrobiota bacterium]
MARLLLPHVRKRPRLEIIPFIDIMFFLLVTFLMVSMKLIPHSGISIRLPGAATTDAQPQKTEVDLTITENNVLFWNKEQIAYEMLSTRLQSIQKDSSQVFIRGDEKANFKRIVQVLDMVRSAGITAVTIATQNQPSFFPQKP